MGNGNRKRNTIPLYGVETHTCGGNFSGFFLVLDATCRSSKKLCFQHTSPTAAADLSPHRARGDVFEVACSTARKVLAAKFEGRRCGVAGVIAGDVIA